MTFTSPSVSLNPIRDKNVRLASHLAVAVRSEHQLLSIRREHRKAIERVIVSDAFQPGAVHINHVEIEIATLRIGDIRRKNYPFSFRKEKRRKTRLIQVRHLPLVRSV